MDPELQRPPPAAWSGAGAAIIAVLVSLALQGLGGMAGPACGAALARPAARVAAALLGAEVDDRVPLHPVLAHPAAEVEVTPDCGGYDFFCLLAGTLTWLTLRHRPGIGAARWLLAVAPATLAVTLAANSLRLLSAFYVRVFGRLLFPESLAPALHFADGVIVFLPALIVTYWIWERMLTHDTRTPTAA